MNAFTQILGGMTQVWLNVAFVVCVFAILTFRPERITSKAKFRAGCILFALSLLIPTISMLLPDLSPETMRRPNDNTVGLSFKIVNLLSVAMYAGAFLVTTGAVMPKGSGQSLDE